MNTFNSTIFSKTILSLGVLLRLAGFFFIMQAVGQLLLIELIDIPRDFSAHPEKLGMIPHIQLILSLVQACGMLIGFILLPLLYMHYVRAAETPTDLFRPVHRQFLLILASVILLVVSVPAIEQLALLNKSLILPDRFKVVEDLMNQTEKSAAALTEILIRYENLPSFLVVFIVVSIIPAVGEELVFRGLIQNELKNIWQNKHLAIWVSGFIFSFIHLQFFGFLPRMLLGVLFGYCYYWTGSLWVPISMHFINNALTLIVQAFFSDSFINASARQDASFDIRFFIAYIVAQVLFLLLYYRFVRQQKLSS